MVGTTKDQGFQCHLFSETGKTANFYQRNATVFLGKLPGTAGTFMKKKIPDVQNLDETKMGLECQPRPSTFHMCSKSGHQVTL